MRKRLAIWIAAIAVITVFIVILIVYVSEPSHPADWTARYDGPAKGFDEALALAVDASGNTYVTGSTAGSGASSDYATVKYDRDGNQLWVTTYDGPPGGHDNAYAIAVDSSGSVYVTGRSEGDGTSYDYATIKYDSDGHQLWAARYDGPANASDGAVAIAVDSTGRVYVTGYSAGSGADYATIRYDTDGNEEWVARYDGPRGTGDRARDLAVDPQGNVYVTGDSSGNNTSTDFATVKYDSGGNLAWVARYDGPASMRDEATAIAVDHRSGNVYVTGQSAINAASSDYATVAYNSDGKQLWAERYNVRPDGEARANAIAVDDEGNIYVTGSCRFTTKGYTQIDIVTVKYGSDGNRLWEARYDSLVKQSDRANAIAVDDSGSVLVAGSSEDIGSGNDYITIKYDSNGEELWHARYDGPDSLDDSARAVGIDDEGNVYVTGFSHSNEASSDFVTVKYAP